MSQAAASIGARDRQSDNVVDNADSIRSAVEKTPGVREVAHYFKKAGIILPHPEQRFNFAGKFAVFQVFSLKSRTSPRNCPARPRLLLGS
jgi:hypothetical protein